MNDLETIKEVLSDVQIMIELHGGELEFIDYKDDYVYVRLSGACIGCDLQDVTLQDGIFEMLKFEVPTIKGVINVDL